MKKIDVVCGYVLKNNKILITQRKDLKNFNKWEFPGGKIEIGESSFYSIQRELKEELDIDVAPLKEILSYPFKNFNLIFIECQLESKTINLIEHKDFRWVRIDELKIFDFIEGDIKFINYIENNGGI
jgi:8-oxo-dGTP diphosphatase